MQTFIFHRLYKSWISNIQKKKFGKTCFMGWIELDFSTPSWKVKDFNFCPSRKYSLSCRYSPSRTCVVRVVLGCWVVPESRIASRLWPRQNPSRNKFFNALNNPRTRGTLKPALEEFLINFYRAFNAHCKEKERKDGRGSRNSVGLFKEYSSGRILIVRIGHW